MTPWCVLACSWRRQLADRHLLPFPWTLSLHRRWCPSASYHPQGYAPASARRRLPARRLELWELWGIMGNYGELWGIMGNYGELWGIMGNYGGIWVELWGIMGNYGGIMGNYGELWGNYGELWGIMGELWVNNGELWGIMGIYG